MNGASARIGKEGILINFSFSFLALDVQYNTDFGGHEIPITPFT